MLTGVVLALIWGGLAYQLWNERTLALAQASSNAANLSRAFAEHVGSTLRAIDHELERLAVQFAQDPARFSAVAAFNSASVLRESSVRLFVVGPDGQSVMNSAEQSAAGIVVAHDYLSVHRDGDHGMFVGVPRQGLLTRKWSLHLSRRINMPDGSFGGAMVASFDPSHLTEVYDAVDLGRYGTILLIGRDGIVRVRTTQTDSSAGLDYRGSDMLAGILQSGNGVGEFRSPIDGIVRIVGIREVPNYPLIMAVGLARNEVFAPLTLKGMKFFVAGLLLSMVFIGLASMLRRQIADQLTTESLLRAKETELIRSRNEAEAANRAKSEFLANMSHELRTPLNAVIGFSEILCTEMLGPLGAPRYRSYAEDIHASGSHLLDIINDVLDLAKVEAGKMPVSLEETELADVIGDATKLMRDRAEKGGVELAAILDGAPRIVTDPLKLRQILLNLLSNAIKFTPAGGKVEVAVGRVASGTKIAISVADTGIGMKPEDIPVALSVFGQIDASASRKFEGTGLGLSLTKRFAELLGGELVIESHFGMGTTVRVILPVAGPNPVEEFARAA